MTSILLRIALPVYANNTFKRGDIMSNRLAYESSPYLLQHKDNPVDWYPWCEEAFQRAENENKPIFLSIGYSTCHWCHVMTHESFEDNETALFLNEHFISIKVDKEERPDIDSIYMTFCQSYTGSGGWPMSIFMSWNKLPFFAGTYFPKNSRYGMTSFKDLLKSVVRAWHENKEALLKQGETITKHLLNPVNTAFGADPSVLDKAVSLYKEAFDPIYGGFGGAPKFPAPHNLIFLLSCYEKLKDKKCLEMAEKTLIQMYRGGIYDHIGSGFCRYSTDRQYLAPHFEKMLYDNALLIMAYCRAYDVTKKDIYKEIAVKTAQYVTRELSGRDGGFFCAQDADSEGEEGRHYLFTPDEITDVLGKKDGQTFCRYYDISDKGNFEGKSIPNLLKYDGADFPMESSKERLLAYRKARCSLHLDDKILSSHNALMIAALCQLYKISGKNAYISEAVKSNSFIQENLFDASSDTLFVSYTKNKRGVKGFLDDYAYYIFALLELYSSTLNSSYLELSKKLCSKVFDDFHDCAKNGFFLWGRHNEALVLRPKETYDGALPSGNSMMAWNLIRLYEITEDESFREKALAQLNFIAADAEKYPVGYAMYLCSLLEYEHPSAKITISPSINDRLSDLTVFTPLIACVTAENRPLIDDKTTYYICRDGVCLPPVNNITNML